MPLFLAVWFLYQAMRLRLLLLFLCLEALAVGEVSSQLKREDSGIEHNADGVNECKDVSDSKHSSELHAVPNDYCHSLMVKQHTVESQPPVFLNVSELGNEMAESHDNVNVVPDNLNNEAHDNVNMVPDNLNCTCSTQDDESHDIVMSRNITVKCSCLTGGDASKSNAVEGDKFKCKFQWHDKELKHLKEKVLDWMKGRPRFTGYNNTKLPVYGSNFTGVLTWVWLSKQQKYMIHFPHNFVSISTATMGVITQDWALDYDESLIFPPLRNHSINIKDKIYQHERSLGYCDPECLDANRSCGLGKHEIVELLTNIGNSAENFEWDWICLQLNYDDIHNITQTGSSPNFVIPDVLYYALFLRKLLIERPWLGLPTRKDQFLHYHCYSKGNLTTTKSHELLEKYIVIPFFAAILWLYFPLLIHYFPSSSKEDDQMTGDFKFPNGMFPTHKVPIYFGRWLKWLFCFYREVTVN